MAFGLDSFSYHLHFGKHYWTPQKSEPRDIFWFLNRAHELGYHGVQIDPLHLGSFEEAHIRRIRAEAEERGLYVEFGTGGYEPGKLRTRLETAKYLGARALRTFLGSDRSDPSAIRRVLEEAVPALREVASDAEMTGIPVAVENHEDLTADELLELIERVGSPMVGACLDTGNSVTIGEDPVHCVELLAPYAKSVHLKDGVPLRSADGQVIGVEGRALGDGELDVKGAVQVIRKAQPGMPMTIELPCRPKETEEETLRWEDEVVARSAKYAREVLGLGEEMED
jgi:sugar phosphate isomerase/epimerase